MYKDNICYPSIISDGKPFVEWLISSEVGGRVPRIRGDIDKVPDGKILVLEEVQQGYHENFQFFKISDALEYSGTPVAVINWDTIGRHKWEVIERLSLSPEIRFVTTKPIFNEISQQMAKHMKMSVPWCARGRSTMRDMQGRKSFEEEWKEDQRASSQNPVNPDTTLKSQIRSRRYRAPEVETPKVEKPMLVPLHSNLVGWNRRGSRSMTPAPAGDREEPQASLPEERPVPNVGVPTPLPGQGLGERGTPSERRKFRLDEARHREYNSQLERQSLHQQGGFQQEIDTPMRPVQGQGYPTREHSRREPQVAQFPLSRQDGNRYPPQQHLIPGQRPYGYNGRDPNYAQI
jgi:hypothetical protein